MPSVPFSQTLPDGDALLAEIVAGDSDAFGRWVAGAEPRLRASLRPLAAHVDAEAVLQESLLRVWQLAPRHVLDGRPDSLLRFAMRVTRNLAIDELRRLRATSLPDEELLDRLLVESGDAEAGGGAPDPLLRQAIVDCHRALTGPPARALTERILSAGAEPDETLAARLGMRKNTFLQNVGRARKLLADCLRKRGVEVPA